MGWLRDEWQKRPSIQTSTTAVVKSNRTLYYVILLSVLGILVWQLSTFQPSKICGILQVINPKNPEACNNLLAEMLNIQGYVCYGLIGCIFVLTMVLGIREWGISARVNGPDGMGIDLNPLPVEVKNKDAIPVSENKDA